ALRVADKLIPEPPGGAHSDPAGTAARVKEALARQLEELEKIDTDELLLQRWTK
ncbi:MAG: acetyl-CoA carboxylase carboxyl transferase subunit alpha, partial [Gemmatimonadetes bacterium]|nr:acetyl-CoA carboxylase carboxyl transferase subunit alpha [Gemmatimonadota bacterium]